MIIIRGIWEIVYSFICLLTLIACLLCYSNITYHWMAGFLMMALPVFILLHIVVMVIAALTGSLLWIRALLLLMVFYPLSSRLYKVGGEQEESTGTSEQLIRVVSFNILNFDEVKTFYEDPKTYERELKSWLKSQEADILVLQEFNHSKGSKKNLTWTWFEDLGFDYYIGGQNKADKLSGPVIISKYPLINREYKDFGALNGLVSADVVVGKDTLTVINVHLHSMTLKLKDLFKQNSFQNSKRVGKMIVDKMKNGWGSRALEVVEVENKILATPYPVILAGDFNETPFSYVYGKVAKLLTNSYEEKGAGFGFTFNQLPYFIRIDNQFFSQDRLLLHSFKTHSDVRFSDHYPLTGVYELKR